MSIDPDYDRNYDYGREVDIIKNDGNLLINNEKWGDYNPNCVNDDRYMGWQRQDAVRSYNSRPLSVDTFNPNINSDDGGSPLYRDYDDYRSGSGKSKMTPGEGAFVGGFIALVIFLGIFGRSEVPNIFGYGELSRVFALFTILGGVFAVGAVIGALKCRKK